MANSAVYCIRKHIKPFKNNCHKTRIELSNAIAINLNSLRLTGLVYEVDCNLNHSLTVKYVHICCTVGKI